MGHCGEPKTGWFPTRRFYRGEDRGEYHCLVSKSIGQQPVVKPNDRTEYGSVSKPCTPVVHIKIAGKWMFIPLKMVCIGIDPYPYHGISLPFQVLRKNKKTKRLEEKRLFFGALGLTRNTNDYILGGSSHLVSGL